MNGLDEQFEDRAREHLNRAADGLDAHIRSRLTQARHAAVEEARNPRSAFAWRTWMPVGGVAAAALAVLVWSGGLRQGEVSSPTPFDDVDIIATDENLEMVEDVEFYAWMEGEPEPLAANGIG